METISRIELKTTSEGCTHISRHKANINSNKHVGTLQSFAPLPMWVMGTWYTQSGMCTYEQLGYTRYQVMNNTWYQIWTGTRYERVPGKSGNQVEGVPCWGYSVRMVTGTGGTQIRGQVPRYSVLPGTGFCCSVHSRHHSVITYMVVGLQYTLTIHHV